jgi:hypothetical protein
MMGWLCIPEGLYPGRIEDEEKKGLQNRVPKSKGLDKDD